MSLYLALGIVTAVGISLRFRYGSDVTPYAAAALLVILFFYCPTKFHPGIQGWTGGKPLTLEEKVDQLSEVVSFGLLVLAAWLAGGPPGKRST